ncbi:MAG TPA: hypothetical protein VN875_09150 [Candidatus Binatus sp.]|nr:hypothetical protein [Candidatus Binatus sp.]
MKVTIALAKKTSATFAQVSNEATALMIKDRLTVDATDLAVYLRTVIGQFKISQPLAIELCRRFENLDRHKQVDGTCLEIDGARSLNAWLEANVKQIGSKRNFYYVRDGGKKKTVKAAPQLTDGTVASKSETVTETDALTLADNLAKYVLRALDSTRLSYASMSKEIRKLALAYLAARPCEIDPPPTEPKPKMKTPRQCDRARRKLERETAEAQVREDEATLVQPTKLRLGPERSRRLKKKTARGVYTYAGTHVLLNPSIAHGGRTHCGIYSSDKPEEQFYGTCKIVAENPNCPSCKWYLKRQEAPVMVVS